MILSPPKRGSHVMSGNTHTHTIINTHPLVNILYIPALIFSSCDLVNSLSQPHHVMASHRKNIGPSKIGRMKLILLHMYQGTPLFSIAASSVIRLLSKATFTPSIQPNLGLPRTRSPIRSAINTFLAIRHSFILIKY